MTLARSPSHVSLVADHIYQVQLPLPFALRIVNCYLLEDDDGWSIIDTGLHTPEGEATWQSVFALLSIIPGDLRRIVITHHHPDHYGMAGWLLNWNGQPVTLYTSAREREMIELVWWQESNHMDHFSDLMRNAGVTGTMLDSMLRVSNEIRSQTQPQAKDFTLIAEDSSLRLGGRDFQVHIGPGHTVAQILLYDEHDRLMICGDHVLLKITPNVGLWPGSETDPLASFLVSLTALSRLDVRLALPGHKTLVYNWQERIAQLQRHHAERLKHIQEAAAHGATVLQIAQTVFNFDLFTPHEMRFAVAETLAHLEYLRLRQHLVREAEDPWYYRRRF